MTQWDVYFEEYQSIYTAVPVMTLPGVLDNFIITCACSAGSPLHACVLAPAAHCAPAVLPAVT